MLEKTQQISSLSLSTSSASRTTVPTAPALDVSPQPMDGPPPISGTLLQIPKQR